MRKAADHFAHTYCRLLTGDDDDLQVRGGATKAKRENLEIPARCWYGPTRFVEFVALTAARLMCACCPAVLCVSPELKVQLAQERKEREALERELEECKQQMAEAGLL